MNVERNVEYGLKLKKVPKGDRAAIVAEMLEIVGLGDCSSAGPVSSRESSSVSRSLVRS